MRVLLVSHAAWRGTGYGAPVRYLARALREHGHALAVLAVEERGPGTLEWQGIRHYLPMPGHRFGEDVLQAVCDDWQSDVVLSLLDPWVLGPDGYAGAGRPWVAWCPVDQDPPQRGLLPRLAHARSVQTFSAFGQGVLARAGVKAGVMPYGVDLDTFRPVSDDQRARLRAAMGLPEDCFLVGMVGTNLAHDRKALAQNILGFCAFAKARPEAHLVLWTTLTGGVNIPALLAPFGGPAAERVHVIPPWGVHYDASHRALAEFYPALDVLLHASAAEGFGLSIIEANACGVPVIGAANSSMSELIPERTGWLVEDVVPEWSWLDGWWRRPTVAGVSEALRLAQDDLGYAGRESWAEECTGWARGFGWDLIGERWDEVLRGLKEAA